MDQSGDDHFRSVNAYLGQMEPDELRILSERLSALVESPGWKDLSALLRLNREQHVRMLCSPKVLAHAEYAFEGGFVAGSATPWSVLEAVRRKHELVQAGLRQREREDNQDGVTG